MFMQLNVTSSDTIIYFFPLFTKKNPKPSLFELFSLCERFPIFLNLCVAVQLDCVHEDVLPALGKIRDKQRSDIQMARGRERSNRLATSFVHWDRKSIQRRGKPVSAGRGTLLSPFFSLSLSFHPHLPRALFCASYAEMVVVDLGEVLWGL